MDAPVFYLLVALAGVSLLVWAYLLSLRGGFWFADQHLRRQSREPATWPEVVAVVPARNEATVIRRTMGSLLSQNYPGPFSAVLVDDHSDDGTAEAAREIAASMGRIDRLAVLRSLPLERGWTGKLWALDQGLRHVGKAHPEAAYLWLTDADIEHDPSTLRRLVAKAEADSVDLVSLMARLRVRRFWEKLLLPAFVFFFQKLYPFRRVNDPKRRTAAAAGGCALVRRRALERAGGIAAIRGELIDDCALARLLKARGPIWLGLTDAVQSLRPYERLADVWNMVSRTAYAQLGRSPLRLFATVVGMVLAYLVPPIVACWALASGEATPAILGLLGWLAMATAFLPTLRLYGLPLANTLLLPAAALLFTLMTVDSALRSWRGREGMWKGRTYAEPAGP